MKSIIDTPGAHSYRGFSIVIGNEGRRVTVVDNYSRSIVVQDELVNNMEDLDRLLSIIRYSR